MTTYETEALYNIESSIKSVQREMEKITSLLIEILFVLKGGEGDV